MDDVQINIALADYMGFPTRFASAKNHAWSEVYYDNEWHVFDVNFSVYPGAERYSQTLAGKIQPSDITFYYSF